MLAKKYEGESSHARGISFCAMRTISFDLLPIRAPRRAAGRGLAYNYELGGRMGNGAVDHSAFGLAAEGSATLYTRYTR